MNAARVFLVASSLEIPTVVSIKIKRTLNPDNSWGNSIHTCIESLIAAGGIAVAAFVTSAQAADFEPVVQYSD